MASVKIVERKNNQVILEVQTGKQSTDYFTDPIKKLRWLHETKKLADQASGETEKVIVKTSTIPSDIEDAVINSAKYGLCEFLNEFLSSNGLFDNTADFLEVDGTKAILHVSSRSITLNINQEKEGKAEKLLVQSKFEMDFGLSHMQNDYDYDVDTRINSEVTLSVGPNSILKYFLSLAKIYLPACYIPCTPVDEKGNFFPVYVDIDTIDNFSSSLSKFIDNIPEDKRSKLFELVDFITMGNYAHPIVEPITRELLYLLHCIFQKK